MGFKLNPPHPRILLFLSSTLCDCVCICQMKVKVTQSCPILCDPMDYTVHWILQASILKGVAFPFSRGSSQPRNWTGVSCITDRFFTNWATRETHTCQISLHYYFLAFYPLIIYSYFLNLFPCDFLFNITFIVSWVKSSFNCPWSHLCPHHSK